MSRQDWDDFKRRVKQSTSIVELVSRYTKLEKKGGRYWGCCPFHSEKSPSFAIKEEEGFWYCFAEHMGGDCFEFLSKKEGLSFRESLEELAKQAGIPVPEKIIYDPKAQEARVEHEKGLALLKRTSGFFHRILMSRSSPGSKIAYDYLIKRGISQQEIESLELGWAPETSQELVKKLNQPGDLLLAEKAYLIRKNSRGPYDFFRGRIMIPIRDARGNVVAFSGRTLDEKVEAGQKYVNSGNTDWFRKNEILYGLDRASGLSRSVGFMCVVEGYFDQWAFHRAGIPAVAVMGTALGETQVRMLAKITSDIVLVFDSDKAGVAATFRNIPPLLRAKLNVRVFSGLQGKDPDEWLAAHSESFESLKNKMRMSLGALEWWVARVLESKGTGRDRFEIFQDLVEPWKLCPSVAHQKILADEIGRFLSLSGKDVEESLRDLSRDGQSGNRQSTLAVPVPLKPIRNEKPSAVAEAIRLWVLSWESLTPNTEEMWDERETLFEGTTVEGAVKILRGISDPKTPATWLEHLAGVEPISSWILGAMMEIEGAPDVQFEEKIILTFNEIGKFLSKSRFESELAQIQSKLVSLPSGSEEVLQYLQRTQFLRNCLEKLK